MIVVLLAFVTLNNLYSVVALLYVLRYVSQMTRTLEAMSARLEEVSARL